MCYPFDDREPDLYEWSGYNFDKMIRAHDAVIEMVRSLTLPEKFSHERLWDMGITFLFDGPAHPGSVLNKLSMYILEHQLAILGNGEGRRKYD